MSSMGLYIYLLIQINPVRHRVTQEEIEAQEG